MFYLRLKRKKLEIITNALAYFTVENFIKAYPTILNGFSLLCAYCLNNHKVTFGRWIGVIAAIGWSSYGVLIDEYSFLFANLIFLWIYASAIYKFNSKRDEYRATFEEQKAEIDRLTKALDKKKAKDLKEIENMRNRERKKLENKKKRDEKVIKSKEQKLLKIAKSTEKQLIQINKLSTIS